jgi:hypothetical protein
VPLPGPHRGDAEEAGALRAVCGSGCGAVRCGAVRCGAVRCGAVWRCRNGALACSAHDDSKIITPCCSKHPHPCHWRTHSQTGGESRAEREFRAELERKQLEFQQSLQPQVRELQAQANLILSADTRRGGAGGAGGAGGRGRSPQKATQFSPYMQPKHLRSEQEISPQDEAELEVLIRQQQQMLARDKQAIQEWDGVHNACRKELAKIDLNSAE